MFRKLTLEDFDVYRDGGSMSVAFLDRKKVLNVLLFPVARPLKSGESTQLFLDPIVKKFIQKEVVSHITGIPRTETTALEEPCSWDYAKKILGKLKSQAETSSSDYKWVYHAMIDVAYSEKHELNRD